MKRDDLSWDEVQKLVASGYTVTAESSEKILKFTPGDEDNYAVCFIFDLKEAAIGYGKDLEKYYNDMIRAGLPITFSWEE